mmetsp:Transcript_57845/g.134751  ORF Transcript_57845/g.134751 Transcript_57845/m.134751 type:complete len:201 (-) Transcript_57845:78-680(-)
MMSEPLLNDGRAGGYGIKAVLVVWCGLGIILLGTYAWGITTLDKEFADSGGAMTLWGHINDPEHVWLFNVYFTSGGLAAVGYLPALAYAFVVMPKLQPNLVNKICGWLLLFYLTELFWMPMCVAYIRSPSSTLFILLRLQLAASGVCGLCWAYFTIVAVPDEVALETNVALRWGAKIGMVVFALHCAVLDAVVWPPFFHK